MHSYVAGSTDGSVRDEVGLRRGARLAGLPGARARDDPQPEHQQGHEESLPDRELWLSRARLHEPHGVRVLGRLLSLVLGGGRSFVRGHGSGRLIVGVQMQKIAPSVCPCVLLGMVASLWYSYTESGSVESSSFVVRVGGGRLGM